MSNKLIPVSFSIYGLATGVDAFLPGLPISSAHRLPLKPQSSVLEGKGKLGEGNADKE